MRMSAPGRRTPDQCFCSTKRSVSSFLPACHAQDEHDPGLRSATAFRFLDAAFLPCRALVSCCHASLVSFPRDAVENHRSIVREMRAQAGWWIWPGGEGHPAEHVARGTERTGSWT